jgi:hypothetical protein
MVVPARLRPEGWPKSIRLPEYEPKLGSLDDPRFLQRVRADARRLNERLDQRRRQQELRSYPDRSLPALAEKYLSSPDYLKLSESRKYRNKRNIRRIIEWSSSRGHPGVETITRDLIDDHLSRYAIGSAVRYDMRAAWSILFSYAVSIRWVAQRPIRGNWFTPQPEKVRLWTDEDAALYATAARKMRQPGLAALIISMLWIGQRLGDMRQAKWGSNFTGDRLIVKQSKTQKPVNIPIPNFLRELWNEVRLEGSAFLFNDADTGTGFTVAHLHQRFDEVRHHLSEDGEEKFLLRGLRHSCVCRMMAAGVPTESIAAVTGHSIKTAHAILERYYVDRTGLAHKAMMDVFKAKGHAPEDFGHVSPTPAWSAEDERRRLYTRPEFTLANFERLYAAMTGQHRHGYTNWLAALPLFGDADANAESESLSDELVNA